MSVCQVSSWTLRHTLANFLLDCPDEVAHYHFSCAGFPSHRSSSSSSEDQEPGHVFAIKTLSQDMVTRTKLLIHYGDKSTTARPYDPSHWGKVSWCRDWKQLVEEEMMNQLKESVTMYNVEMAIWLGRPVLQASQDSHKGGGNLVYACRDSYTDEFKSSDEVMSQVSALS